MSVDRILNFIGGEWTWPEGAEEILSVDPSDRCIIIGRAPDSSAAEVDRAVQAAAAAYPAWRRMPPPERAAIISRAGEIMAERKTELGELVTRECGKPIAEGLGEVQEAIDMAELSAGEGRRLYGETTTSEMPDKMCFTVREPVGICGLITPWNFPIAIPSWKSLAALICGNTLVLKPAEDTPLCAVEYVRCLEDAGLPPGVLNIVHGRGPGAGEAMLEHPQIHLISFTGSTATGKRVAEVGGRTGKNIALECGGKNAAIVMDDADIDLAVDGVLWGAFGTAGQRCTATSRLILHEAVYDRILDRLLSGAAGMKIGAGIQSVTQVCPVINETQFKKIMEYIDIARSEGVRVECGGERANSDELQHGWFVQPTVLTQVKRSMRVFKEEIFGPVLSVIRISNLQEAVETLNDCSYGLSSAIYTRDINSALQAMRAIEAGIVYINGPTIGAEVHLPFGGVKGTGNGHREAGKTGLDIFSEWKTVYIDYSGKLQRAQIDNY